MTCARASNGMRESVGRGKGGGTKPADRALHQRSCVPVNMGVLSGLAAVPRAALQLAHVSPLQTFAAEFLRRSASTVGSG